MEIVTSTATKVAKWLWVPIGRGIGYLLHFKTNIEKLRVQVEALRRRKNDVQRFVDHAEQRLEEPTEEVKYWLQKVNEAEIEVDKIEAAARENKRCLYGWCASWSSQYQLSKEAEEKATLVEEIYGQGVFSRVSHKRPQPVVVPIPTDCEDSYMSVTSAKKQVMEALYNDAIKLIGVHGMGGVGKTTLMRKINNELGETNLFNKVIMVTVSKDCNLRRIQDAIAERLGFKIKDETDFIRANNLQERLKKEKTVLIILDDLWSEINIAELGIPFRGEHQGCKIVLTTRIEDVCLKMGTDQMIKLEVLSVEESWDLFKRKAGDIAESPTFHSIARNIASLCGGLPLAIVAIASSLKVRRSEIVWMDAYDVLKNPTMEVESMLSSFVVESLRFSYDHLDNENIKLFFLLCCLFPEDYSINVDELIYYGVSERLMKVDGSFENARKRGNAFIDNLKGNSLLLESGTKYVMLHDIVRDVAIAIASRECGFFVKTGVGLDRWPEENDLEGCKRISLMNNEITSLVNQPKCPQLLTLLLENNHRLESISNHFFEEMRALVVLDLSETSIQQLPSSISCLKNLRTLCLNRCYKLKDISTTAGLDKLEILRLRFSGIAKLGEEIGGMINLKHLHLGGTPEDKIVSPNVILRLSNLEELYIVVSPVVWDVEKIGDGRKANFSEVTSLTRLTALYVVVKDNSCLFQDYSASDCLKNLKTFHICLGCEERWNENEGSRILSISRGAIPFPDWVRVLLSKAEELHVHKISGLKNILQLYAGGFSNSCSKEEEPMIAAEDQEATRDALRRLKLLKIRECDELKDMLFNSNILLKMCSLEVIEMDWCEKLTEVFNSQGTIEGNNALVPKLTKLVLLNLQSLEIIWKGTIPVGSLNSLKVLHVSGCGKLKYLLSPVLAQTLENLMSLRLSSCKGINKLISDEEESSQEKPPPNLLRSSIVFNNLQFITIHDCHRLKYVLTSRSMQHLVKLEALHILYCNEIEEIISLDNQMMVDNNVLPVLKNLDIGRMPKLTSICKGRVTFEWPSLTRLTVMECPNLKMLPLGSQSAPNLKTFEIESEEWLDQLEWEDQDIESRLQALLKTQTSGQTCLFTLWRNILMGQP